MGCGVGGASLELARVQVSLLGDATGLLVEDDERSEAVGVGDAQDPAVDISTRGTLIVAYQFREAYCSMISSGSRAKADGEALLHRAAAASDVGTAPRGGDGDAVGAAVSMMATIGSRRIARGRLDVEQHAVRLERFQNSQSGIKDDSSFLSLGAMGGYEDQGNVSSDEVSAARCQGSDKLRLCLGWTWAPGAPLLLSAVIRGYFRGLCLWVWSFSGAGALDLLEPSDGTTLTSGKAADKNRGICNLTTTL